MMVCFVPGLTRYGPILALAIVVALVGVVNAKPTPIQYGTRVQFYLGQAVVFPDLEITFDGGGTAPDASGVSREYRAFRVWSKGKAILLAWFDNQVKPIDFQIAGKRYKFQVSDSSNPRADGALTVWKSP